LETQNITSLFEGFAFGSVPFDGSEALFVAGFDTFFGHDLVL